jgi:hypothetical protein
MFKTPDHGPGRLLGRHGWQFLAGATSVVVIASMSVTGAQAVPSSFIELDGNVVSNGTGTYDWANSGALTTTGGFFTRSGTGGIFDGGQFNGTTTPPTAPSVTAAAAADATIAAAEFKVDPLSVDVTSCGSGDPTAYTGAGSETNGSLLSTDTYGTASVPNKDDLSNVYAAAHIDGATNEVFFGAERVINNGDSHIDFEFLQGAVGLTGTCSGSFTGNRAQGDFLLSVDFTSGGTLGGTTLYQWHCVAESGTQPVDGTVCNPPAHGKSVPHYQQSGTNAVTINVNGAGTVGCGGWVCRLPNGSSTTSLLQNELMEGGIDLAQLGFTGCISTFLPHTRSSQSFTAVLKDFEIIPFDTCKAPTVTTLIQPAGPLNIGDSAHDTAQINGGTADAGGTITYKLYSDSTCTTEIDDLTPTNNTVVNGVAPDSDSHTFTSAGTFYFYAEYSGDARNAGPVNSGCAAEPLVISPNAPAPHSTPVVQIKDTLTVTGLSSDATGNVLVGLYSGTDCSGTQIGTNASFPVSGAVGGTLTAETSFVGALSGSYSYKISYAGDNNNTGFSNCDEQVDVTITSLT